MVIFASAARGDAVKDVNVVNTPLPVVVQGVLAPTKPSDLVTIRTGQPARKCGSSPWLALDGKINPDGTLSPFTIPTGKVLVVTSIDWRQGSTGSPGKQEEFFLFPSEANISVNEAIVDSLTPGSSDGRAGTSLVVTGVAIKAGTPCWGVNSANLGSADALVHGFLTDDR